MATYYLSDADITAGVFDTLTESAPSAADSSSGWTVGKNASPDKFYEWRPDAVAGRNDFTTEPSAFTQFGYRTSATLAGDFANTAWTLYGSVVNDATYSAQDGIVGFRLWRSVNADGSSATQITSAWQDSSTISFASGSDPQTFSIVVNPGAITLTDEYLFLEVEWECTVSGGNNVAAVYWTHNDGTQRLVTPTFTPDAVTHALAGTLTAVGGGTAAGLNTAPLSGTLAAVGGGTAAGTVVSPMSGTLAATGGGTAAGTVEDFVHQFAGTLTAVGGGIAAGIAVAALSATLAIIGGGTAAGTVESPLSGTHTATGGGTAAGIDVAPLSGTLTAVGGGTAAGTVEDSFHALTGTLTATGGGTAAGTSVHPLAGTLTATGGGTAAGAVRTPGNPIARYLFEDDVVDHQGNYPGTPTSITYTAAGRDGKAAVFDGDDASVNLGDVFELNLATTGTFTFWLKLDAPSDTGTIFAKELDGGNYLTIKQTTASNGTLELSTGKGGALFGTRTVVLGALAAGWHHFAVTLGAIYVDGVLPQQGTSGARFFADMATADAVIGAASSSFAGDIDDFRIYSTDLTLAQVQAVRLEALPRGNRLRRSHFLPFDERPFWESAVVSAATPLAGTLTIVGGGTAAGTVEVPLSGTLAITGGGTAAGTVESPLSGTLAIVGGGTAAGTDVAPLSGTLAIVGGGTAAGTVEDPSHQLSGTLAITGGGTAAGTDVAPLSGTLAITGGGTAAGGVPNALSGTLSLTGGGTAAGTVEDAVHQLNGELTITGGGTAAGTVEAPLSATLTIVGGGTAAGGIPNALSGTLTFTGGGTAAGEVALPFPLVGPMVFTDATDPTTFVDAEFEMVYDDASDDTTFRQV